MDWLLFWTRLAQFLIVTGIIVISVTLVVILIIKVGKWLER